MNPSRNSAGQALTLLSRACPDAYREGVDPIGSWREEKMCQELVLVDPVSTF